MKKAIVVLAAIALLGFSSVPALCAEPAAETGEKSIDWPVQETPGVFAEQEPVLSWYYIDLMSNADVGIGGWQSFLVVTNWDKQAEITVRTEFSPIGRKPGDDIVTITREHTIIPYDVKYLNANALGFTGYGQPTNWYGTAMAYTRNWWSVGVLLYHSEYGLAWIRAGGPFF